MKVDLFVGGMKLQDVQTYARAAEDLGFGGMVMTEGGRTAYLSVAAAALATERLEFNTGVALAFTRSPMVTAGIAWELAEASEGRFSLGLGTQVRAHIERRYSAQFQPPGPRMREHVEAIRHIWDCFQNGTKLNYEGEYINLSLLNGQWSAGRIDYPDIPLYISAVGPYMLKLAGELCDGVHIHPFHSRDYIDGFVLPKLAEGALKSGRDVDEVKLTIPVMTVIGDSEEERAKAALSAKKQIAFYGSTRNYARVFEHHGFEGLSAQLNDLMKSGQMDQMVDLITDEMLDLYCVVSTWDELSDRFVDRYAAVADRVIPYFATDDYRRQNGNIERWAETARDITSRTS
jgi:probable F420-dependent oxidoreductase